MLNTKAFGKKKVNLHTHSTWCDGKNTPEEMIQAAIERNFSTLGFSSHVMLPEEPYDWMLTREKLPRYVAEIRALAEKYKDKIQVLCGVEADYVPGGATPDRSVYAPYGIDYIIGSVHFVRAADNALVCVDESPEALAAGLRDHYDGNAEAFVRDYYREVREMLRRYDFDILGHVDLVTKFNEKHPYFDETADWYADEVRETIAAIREAKKTVELNAGGIARGWRTEFYPSRRFCAELSAFNDIDYILSSDAHSTDALDVPYEKSAIICNRLNMV